MSLRFSTPGNVTLVETPEFTTFLDSSGNSLSGYDFTIIIPEFGEADVFTTHNVEDMEIGQTVDWSLLFSTDATDDSFKSFRVLFDNNTAKRARIKLANV